MRWLPEQCRCYGTGYVTVNLTPTGWSKMMSVLQGNPTLRTLAVAVLRLRQVFGPAFAEMKEMLQMYIV